VKTARSIHALCVPLLLAFLAAGCGGGKNAADDAAAYRRLAASAVTLSIRIEPLRCSRLGLVSADSLLFTYSKRETDEAIKLLKGLESQFAKIPAGRLDAADVDRATVIINWLRGTRFAFEVLGSARSSPLLYTWAAEEALWTMPSRVAPPYAGELEAYRKRVLRVPRLLSTGTVNLENPADWHLRRALERIDTLEAGLPRLARLVEARYGTSLSSELDAVRFALRDFREFASSALLPASYGRIIIGSENLTKIFRYDEMIDSDPNVLVAEAEKQITRIEGERTSLLRRIEFERERGALADTSTAPRPANESFEAKAVRMLEKLAGLGDGGASAGGPPRERAPIVYPSAPRYVSRSSKNPCLSIPPACESAAIAPAGPAPPCRVALALPAAARRESEPALRFALLGAVPRMLEPERLRCEARDTVSTIFASATFEAGWRYLAVLELSAEVKKSDAALYNLILEDQLRQYARLIVVLSLHAGTMTSEAAAGYLVSTLSLERGEAEREVLAASVSPSLAYPAISMMLVDEMIKNVSYVFGYAKPQAELAKMLLASRDLPLPMILPKTREN
jgi:hypothetical protein